MQCVAFWGGRHLTSEEERCLMFPDSFAVSPRTNGFSILGETRGSVRHGRGRASMFVHPAKDLILKLMRRIGHF